MRKALRHRKLLTLGLLILGLLVAGTGGYMLISGVSFLDALYMTVISITTVGYREIIPLTRSGKIFTIVLIVVGLGIVFYFLQTIVEDALGRYLAWGCTLLLVVQALLHVSVALALAPTTGMPLPFISHGGSSLVSTLIACGVILNVSQHRLTGHPLEASWLTT